MKIAITGKGGAGKTTVSALLADALHRRGHSVIAIDADPDSNLAACMGHPAPETIKPLIELKDLIEERTGAKPGTTGGMFRLNPFVADIPDNYAEEINGVKVLVSGGLKKGGTGCYCPENAMVRALVSHLLLEKDTALILDMEAGVEHLGRGTVQAVDQLLIVANPGRRSIETAERIRALAADIGLTRVSAIGNRVRSTADTTFLKDTLAGLEFAGFVPFHEAVLAAERDGRSVATASPALTAAADNVVTFLEAQLKDRAK